MREITKKILALGLFKVESTEAADTKHWEDADHLTLLENDEARLVLRIENQCELRESYSIGLEVDQFDIHGNTFLNDSIWSLYGGEAEMISGICDADWSLQNLGPYQYLFNKNIGSTEYL